MSTKENLPYQVALTLIPKIGDVLIRQLISYCGSAEQVFKTPVSKLLKIPNIGKTLALNLQDRSVLDKAFAIIEEADRQQVDLLFYTDKNYPNRLKQLYDAPVLLYYKGNANLNHSKTVAIVGTRQCTEYGRNVTEELVEDLKDFNPLVISGLAYGIDIVAHKACLKNDVPTLGVMASGIDFIYPYQHKNTSIQMQETGGILTEQMFGVQPDPRFFPQRNRIIAGMSDVTIVIEAAVKGGALITAEYANNYHRDIFAVPGQLGKSFSEGCNKLIKEKKAEIYTSIKDIVETLNWDLAGHEKNNSFKNTLDLTNFTDDESQVMALLHKNQVMEIDVLAWQSQIHIAKLSSLLLNLEFQGVLKSLPGKKYAISMR
ncbi:MULTISPECIES: DNA-processing protein DprA [unclassified Arcicella]|uniref:DNA-processing protein DprA n=1 Tax=unclassified Arcicella TaxID=2644986 RepID=UPI0028651891|nr:MULTISPECIES: DNA-processing protein DprA [unclassified Arcicella]MDR6562820.1 DNA processing protein [Arcicella sp. BE51]MDR6812838.1 DNA processing protein [Arcicella sp. BE140]MDR6824150.1 DNA processing protein [Arcicella sp. BE139]